MSGTAKNDGFTSHSLDEMKACENVVSLDEALNHDLKEPIVLDESAHRNDTKERPKYMDTILLTELRTKIESDLTNELIDGLNEIPMAESVDDTHENGSFWHTTMPVHSTGRFESLKELIAMINADANVDNGDKLDDFKAAMKCVAIVPALIRLSQKTTIMKDHFRVAQTRSKYLAKGPGVHYPALTNFRWYDKPQIFDDEQSPKRRITPNHTILQVRANHVGIARINSAKGTVAETDASESTQTGADGDTVLFYQGKYLLRESEYAEIQCVYIDPSQSVLDIGGSATMVRIGPAQMGGAYSLKRNQFEMFETGAYILSRKEWTNAIVVNRTTTVFTLGNYVQFIPLEQGQVASISRKDGLSFLIGRPGLYILKQDNWNFSQTAVHENERNYEVGSFLVRTVDPAEIAVARCKQTNDAFLLKAGKYYLNSSFWDIDVVRINSVEIHIKPFTLVQVGENLFVGARNNITGSWVEFHEQYKNKIIVLHESQYSSVVQVPKLSHSISKFGPYFTILVPCGKRAIFDRRGTITCEGSGSKRLQIDQGLILEPLPETPQTLSLPNINFLSSDDYDLGITVKIHFQISDFIKLSTLLRSRCVSEVNGIHDMNTEYVDRNDPRLDRLQEKHTHEYEQAWTFSFDDFQLELQKTAEKFLLSRLRTYKSSQLLHNGNVDSDKEIVEANIVAIGRFCQEELQRYVDMNDIGLAITKVNLLGGFRYCDTQVIDTLKERTLHAVKVKTIEMSGKANAAMARAKAQAAIEKANEENAMKKAHARNKAEVEVIETEQKQKRELMKQQALLVKAEKEQEIQRLQLELEKQREEQRLLLEIQRCENELKIEKLKRESENRAKVEAAEAEAAAVRKIFEAEAENLTRKHQIAAERPQNLNVEEVMKLMNQGLDNFGKSAWRHPDTLQAMIGLQKASSGNGSGSTGGQPQGYGGLVNNSLHQALTIMQGMQLQQKFDKKEVLVAAPDTSAADEETKN